jgi:hypothetical protein
MRRLGRSSWCSLEVGSRDRYRSFFPRGNQPRRINACDVRLASDSHRLPGGYKRAYEAFEGEFIQSSKELLPLDGQFRPRRFPFDRSFAWQSFHHCLGQVTAGDPMTRPLSLCLAVGFVLPISAKWAGKPDYGNCTLPPIRRSPAQ